MAIVRAALAAAAVLTVGTAGVATAREAPATPSSADWPAYLNGPQHTSYNPAATAITTANADSLTTAWTFAPPGLGVLGNKFISSPVISVGNVYIGSGNGTFYDLNEATGAVVWSHFIGQQPKLTCPSLSFATTATVAPDPGTGRLTVYESAPDGYLYAWDASTGNQLWRSVVALPSTTQSDYFDWASATVVNGKIYVGVSSNCDVPLIQAGLRSYDQASGTQLASFQVNPTGDLGGSIWGTPLVTPDGVYVTTGNQQAGGALGDSQAIIRLDPTTLAQKDIFSVPAADRVGDGDFGYSPATWTANLGGTPTTMVGACNKNGKFYALRAANLAAGAVWTDQLGFSEQNSGHQSLCIAGGVWDGSRLFLASNATTINGTPSRGSVREVNPATGVPLWQTPLPGAVLGTPTLDGAGVLAVGTSDYSGVPNAVYLLNAATGSILTTLSTSNTLVFAQPVLANGYLFVATMGAGLIAWQLPATPPKPSVTAVSPNSGPGSGGTTVTITGSHFTGATGVHFGATPASTFTVVSGSQITARSPAGTAGSVDVTVTTAAGTGPTSPTDFFTYGTSVSLSLKPSSIPADAQSTATATATVVNFNGAPMSNETLSFSIAGPETIGPVTNNGNGTYSATITSSKGPGQYPITVTDTSASPTASTTAMLTQTSPTAPPAVTGLSPSSGPAGGGTTVTITGLNFTGASDVRFGTSQAATFSVDSPTQITAVSPAAPPGVKSAVVHVTTSAGTSAGQSGDRFTYTFTKPVVTAISPTTGAISGGTTVTITGTALTGATAVSFGNTPAATFSVDSDTQITVTSPSRPAGTIHVVVTSPAGMSAKVGADRFTYQ